MPVLIPIPDNEEAINKLEDAGFKYCGASTQEMVEQRNTCGQSREVGVFFKKDRKAALLKYGMLQVNDSSLTKDIRDALEESR